jgi:hypothetical protein
MSLSKGQFSTLSDICRETAVVILGGLVIGNLLSSNAKVYLTIGGIFIYLILGYLSVVFKKKGE